VQPADSITHPVDEATIMRMERNQAAIDLLRSWREQGDVTEQRETGAYLLQVLTEDDIVIGQDHDGDRA
jgi:hypothetical protein